MSTYKVEKTDAEWREQLSPMDYQVTRQAATERPFSGRYWDHFEKGDYRCVCCGKCCFNFIDHAIIILIIHRWYFGIQCI